MFNDQLVLVDNWSLGIENWTLIILTLLLPEEFAVYALHSVGALGGNAEVDHAPREGW
jgi:hypothetical protein